MEKMKERWSTIYPCSQPHCMFLATYFMRVVIHWPSVKRFLFLPQIYGIASIHLPLLSYSPNFSPSNSLSYITQPGS